MNLPERLLSLPELARRLGIFYSVAYRAYQSGELVPNFISNKQALFDQRLLEETARGLRKQLNAEEFDELLIRARRVMVALAAKDDQSDSSATNDTLRFIAATKHTPAAREDL